MADDADPVVRSTPGASPPAQTPTSPGSSGMLLGDWLLGDEIGHGAMGVVYRARHATDGRVAAVKVLSPRLEAEERFVERFEREAQAMRALAHPNIVAILDQGVTDGLPWIAMELVEGGNICDWTRPGHLDDARLLRFAIGVCDGLAYAHGQGVLHRDLKPANLLIGPAGQPKIADFGLARLFGDRWIELSALSATSDKVGTPFYMAPEVLKGEEADGRADVYSLGVVLYQALTLELPLGRVHPPKEIRPALDRRLDSAVMLMLEPIPGCRLRSAEVAARVLTDVLERPDAPDLEPIERKPDNDKATRQSRWRAPVSVVVAVATIAAAGIVSGMTDVGPVMCIALLAGPIVLAGLIYALLEFARGNELPPAKDKS